MRLLALPAVVIVALIAFAPMASSAGVTAIDGAERDGERLTAWAGERVLLETDFEGRPGVHYSFEWSMGDGTLEEGSVISHVFEEKGSYNVTVRISNETELVGTEHVIVDVKEQATIFQLVLFTVTVMAVPLALLATLNVVVIVGGRLARRLIRPGVKYERWTLRSITMFNLLLVTIPVAAIMSPIYIVPAAVGTVMWVAFGLLFATAAPFFLGLSERPGPFRNLRGRFGVIDREIVRYHPLRKNLWSAVKQRSGIALEMMPVPLFGIFIVTALLFRYVGDVHAVMTSVWFYTLLAMAPIFTAPLVVLRIFKDSNLLYVNGKKVHIQYLGDIVDGIVQKFGILGSVTALFQITIVLSPNISSAWGLMLVLIPTITGLVLAYLFLTAFVYLGFHPKIVKRLNAALMASHLPKYSVSETNGAVAFSAAPADSAQKSS